MRDIPVEHDLNAHITDINCKVIPKSGYCEISFSNLDFGVITAVKFSVSGVNAFGDPVLVDGKESFFLIVQDISVEKYASISNIKLKLPDDSIQALNVHECQVRFADGNIVSYEGRNTIKYTLQEYEANDLSDEIREARKTHFGYDFKYKPKKLDSGWVCGCGKYNPSEYDKCRSCANEKDDVLSLLDEATDSQLLDSLRISKKKQEAEEAKQRALKKEKGKKKALTISIISVLSIALISVIAFFVILSGRSTFDSPEAMKEALQGTYTYYSGSKGYASDQIIIDGDTVTFHSWLYTDESIDIKGSFRNINYKFGSFTSIGKQIVLKDGNIKDGDRLYIKDPTPIIRDKTTQRSTLDDMRDQLNALERAEDVLAIWGVKIESNSSYTVCTGNISNDGNYTYKFVEVKGSFTNASGTVIDTAWTYAVGQEGIAPGETTTFRLSVPLNSKITGCSVSILDYERK